MNESSAPSHKLGASSHQQNALTTAGSDHDNQSMQHRRHDHEIQSFRAKVEAQVEQDAATLFTRTRNPAEKQEEIERNFVTFNQSGAEQILKTHKLFNAE